VQDGNTRLKHVDLNEHSAKLFVESYVDVANAAGAVTDLHAQLVHNREIVWHALKPDFSALQELISDATARALHTSKAKVKLDLLWVRVAIWRWSCSCCC
jgi:hypothetical protein